MMEHAKWYVYPLRLTEDAQKDLAKIMSRVTCTKADAIRDAISHYAEFLEGLEVVEFRDLSVEETKKEVRAYVTGKERVGADEIGDALHLDVGLVNKVLFALRDSGEVEPL